VTGDSTDPRNGGSPEDELTPQCGAKTANGTPCKNQALANGYCWMHGGAGVKPDTPATPPRCRTCPRSPIPRNFRTACRRPFRKRIRPWTMTSWQPRSNRYSFSRLKTTPLCHPQSRFLRNKGWGNRVKTQPPRSIHQTLSLSRIRNLPSKNSTLQLNLYPPISGTSRN